MERIATGKLGEQVATEFLRAAGYGVVARNYRARPGEIDIVARKSGVLVFVEVKTRRTTIFGSPAEAVTLRKQRTIIQTALCYLKQTGNDEAAVRFDIVEVRLGADGGKPHCNHIVNAFGR